MMKAGIKIYEYQGTNMIHAKSMVVDGRIAMLGSYNFDRLSEQRNSELAFVVTECQFCKTGVCIHFCSSFPSDGDSSRYFVSL